MVKRFLLTLIFVLFSTLTFASWEDCINATCRVTSVDSNGQAVNRGSGCVYKETKDAIYILTNYHIVGTRVPVKCEFWHNGQLQKAVSGKIIKKSREYDIAIIEIPKSVFKGYLPTIIPLASSDYKIEKDQVFITVGCAKAAWATLVKGHIEKPRDDYDYRMSFEPRPATGRSGSAIFDEKGERIIGLLFAHTPIEWKQKLGYAKTLAAIYKVIEEEKVIENPFFLTSAINFRYYYFTTEGCFACNKQAKIIAQLQEKGYNFRTISYSSGSPLIKKYDIQSYPTIVIILGNERVVVKITGKIEYSHLYSILWAMNKYGSRIIY